MRSVLTASLLSIALAQGTAYQAEPIDPEAYRVYAALMPHESIVRDARPRVLVLQEETSTPALCRQRSGGLLETEWLDVRDGFLRQNAAPKRLQPDQDIGIPYRVVSRSSIDALFAKAGDPTRGWVDFDTTYPGTRGYLVVSAVGFDGEKTRGMAYIWHSCGEGCGEGRFAFLDKKSGRWQEIKLRGWEGCSWAS